MDYTDSFYCAVCAQRWDHASEGTVGTSAIAHGQNQQHKIMLCLPDGTQVVAYDPSTATIPPLAQEDAPVVIEDDPPADSNPTQSTEPDEQPEAAEDTQELNEAAQAAQRYLSQHDLNGDGKITQTESGGTAAPDGVTIYNDLDKNFDGSITDDMRRQTEYENAFEEQQASLEQQINSDETGFQVQSAAEQLEQSKLDQAAVQKTVDEIKEKIDANLEHDSIQGLPVNVARAEQADTNAQLEQELANAQRFGTAVANMTPTERENLDRFFKAVEEDPEGVKKYFEDQKAANDALQLKIKQVNAMSIDVNVKRQVIAQLNSGNDAPVEALVAWFTPQPAAGGSGGSGTEAIPIPETVHHATPRAGKVYYQ